MSLGNFFGFCTFLKTFASNRKEREKAYFLVPLKKIFMNFEYFH